MRTHIRVALRRALARRAGRVRGEQGFTIVEALAAIAILGIGLGGLLSAMTAGYTGLDSARRSSTALFLAEQRIEQIKAFALSAGAGQGWANVTTANFPAEGYGAVTGYGSFRRTVTIVDSPGGAANTKQVQVAVFYRPATEGGLAPETSVGLATLLVQR